MWYVYMNQELFFQPQDNQFRFILSLQVREGEIVVVAIGSPHFVKVRSFVLRKIFNYLDVYLIVVHVYV